MPSYNDQLEEVILERNAFEKEVIELKKIIEMLKDSRIGLVEIALRQGRTSTVEGILKELGKNG